jgi:argininosuccinate synthase
VSVDVGQGEDLGELRRRALSCGALRAHAVDVRDELARAVFAGPCQHDTLGEGGYPRIDEWPRPLIARALLEIARIEGAHAVAHGSLDHALEEAIAAIDPAMPVLAPARQWQLSADARDDYARVRGIVPPSRARGGHRIDENVWGRIVSWQRGEEPPPVVLHAGPASTEQARLDIGVEHGLPVSINGVPMSPAELVESLALIAGRHGVGRFETGDDGRLVVCDAPAAVVLRAALAAAGEGGVARLAVLNGTCALLPSDGSEDAPSSSRDPEVELVNQV